jgi:hypothetical protein
METGHPLIPIRSIGPARHLKLSTNTPGPGAPLFSSIHNFPSSSREVIAKVVGRVASRAHEHSPAPDSSLFAFERSLPGQLDVSHHTTQLRGRQRQDRLLCGVQYHANVGRQRLSSISPRIRPQIIVADTCAPQDTDSYRHQAHLASEDVCSSACRSHRAEHHIRLPTHVLLLPFLFNLPGSFTHPKSSTSNTPINISTPYFR